MKNNHIISALLVFIVAVATIPMAFGSAQSFPTHFNTKEAVSEWTVNTDSGPVTMFAVLDISSKGVEQLMVAVTHPQFGTWVGSLASYPVNGV